MEKVCENFVTNISINSAAYVTYFVCYWSRIWWRCETYCVTSSKCNAVGNLYQWKLNTDTGH